MCIIAYQFIIFSKIDFFSLYYSAFLWYNVKKGQSKGERL